MSGNFTKITHSNSNEQESTKESICISLAKICDYSHLGVHFRVNKFNYNEILHLRWDNMLIIFLRKNLNSCSVIKVRIVKQYSNKENIVRRMTALKQKQEIIFAFWIKFTARLPYAYHIGLPTPLQYF